ncbi:MAG: hypothetical protein J5767_09805 [Paludibacteraceae bacterium]|nr:hypothetical protein [Paludibacteraceae bacterium]
MNSIKRSIFLFIGILLGCSAMGDAIEVAATLSPSEMKIGEQSKIQLEITQPQSASVLFPIISSDTLIPGIEILSISKLDTTKEGGNIKVSQEIIITSFDSGSYAIPAFVFESKVKKYETEKLFLNVTTIEEDFVHAQIKGLKDNYDPGINWKRIFLYISIFAIIVGLAFIGFIVYQYYLRLKDAEVRQKVKKVDPRLPHEIALEELNVIKEEKVWKQGQTKQYYTSITDTLREYFVKRFKISAMEMTSSEIIDSLQRNNDAAPVIDNMKQIFSTSDMVKFAKQEPTLEENELSILNAYRIINETIYIPPKEEIDDIEGTPNNAGKKVKASSPINNIKRNIKGIEEGLTDEEINKELELGGKFIHFQYTISIVVMTFKLNSKLYFLKTNESAIKYGYKYLLISLILGWWGIPWGPLYTIQSIKIAFTGKDVTNDLLKKMEESSYATKKTK